MKILLIRHGDPDYEKDSLTEKGWHEAELLAQRMAELEIQSFYKTGSFQPADNIVFINVQIITQFIQ